MVCKTTSTSRGFRRGVSGSTLAEVSMAIGITSILMVVLASISMLSGRSFTAFFNYVDLNDSNRIAMDTLTRDLRECNRISGFTSSVLTIEDSDLATITYTYSSSAKTLARAKNGVTRTLLKGCDTLTFSIAQRNPIGGTYDVYPAATVSTAKVVNVKWNCSRTIFGRTANTENVQTARIVIRKQT